jgi:hypothetical protein
MSACRSLNITHENYKGPIPMCKGDTFGESIRSNHSFASSGLNLAYEGLLLGMWIGNRREPLMKPHLMRINLCHHCPHQFCRNERHRLVAEPPPRLQLSTPPKPILSEVIMSVSDEVEARLRIRCAITGAELIEDPEAVEEHRPVEVLGRKLSSNGHVLVHNC